MKVVLDSSVLIAALISRAGVSAAVLEDVIARHDFIASPFIVDEVVRTLAAKFAFPKDACTEVRAFLSRAATLVDPRPVPDDACRDEHDLPILGTCLAADAQLLVTVDRDLLEPGSFGRTLIVRPGDFWRAAGRAT